MTKEDKEHLDQNSNICHFCNDKIESKRIYEQLIEYRIIYKRVAICLFIFIGVILWISYPIYLKFFYIIFTEIE